MPRCPECNSTDLSKLGEIWSGRKKKQNYKCNSCGRNTVNTLPDENPGTNIKESKE